MDIRWIQTRSGVKFYPLDPDPALIRIDDIAHSLANQCRFSGHSKRFYSVAEHSVIMSGLFETYVCRLEALLHDAAEAYLTDVPSPIKYHPKMSYYREAEKRLQAVIYARWGLDETKSWAISEADKHMLNIEAVHPSMMRPRHPHWPHYPVTLVLPQDVKLYFWTPEQAAAAFLERFKELVKGTIYETDYMQARTA